jgi:hypothetical protein
VEEIYDMWVNLLISISELFFHVIFFSNQKQIEGLIKWTGIDKFDVPIFGILSYSSI